MKCLKGIQESIIEKIAEANPYADKCDPWYFGYIEACEEILLEINSQLSSITIRENNGQERTEGEAIQ